MSKQKKDATQPDAPSDAPVSIVDDVLARLLAAIVLRGGREAAIVTATGIPGLVGPRQGDAIN